MNISNEIKYGVKKNGEARKAPGRKVNPSLTKTVFVRQIDGVWATYKSVKGRPSLETYRSRRQVTIPRHAEYDYLVHGIGVRLESDENEVKRIEMVQAMKASGTPVAQPETQPEAQETPKIAFSVETLESPEVPAPAPEAPVVEAVVETPAATTPAPKKAKKAKAKKGQQLQVA